jgi:DNA primase
MDMVEYLSGIGHEPQKNVRNSYWYLSPFRDEKTASFKVNRAMNRWYDFAEGKGGNLVDFGIRYHQCSVSEFLNTLEIFNPSFKQHQVPVITPLAKEEEVNKITVLSAHHVSAHSLVKYLQTRRIPFDIANKYLKEVWFSNSGKTYYALGFKNDAGGYELRNENFKGSSSPKDTSFIDNGACNVAVFEGFFDFLSHRTMYYKQEQPLLNFMVLNSTAFFEKSIPKMLEHNRVHLYLDNDATGQKCSQLALDLNKQKFVDERILYKQYDDLNDWLMHIGQSQKQQLRLKP